MFLVKRSLFAKILLSMLLAIIIPFLLTNLMSYRYIRDSVKEQLVELNQNSLAITISGIHDYIHELSFLASSYYNDNELIRLLTKEEMQTLAESAYIREMMEEIYGSYTEISQLTYKSALTNKQIHVKSDVHEPIRIPDFKGHRLISLENGFDREYSVIEVNGDRRLRMNKPFIDTFTREVIGITSMTVKDDQLERLLEPLTIHEDDSEAFILLGEEMDLLFASVSRFDSDWIEQLRKESFQPVGITVGSINTSDGVYIYYRDVSYNLPITLVKYIPQYVIDEAGVRVLSRSIVLQTAGVVFVAVMAGVISYFILTRVKRIHRIIKDVRMGKFHMEEGSNRGTDELGVLEDKFKEMIGELDELYNRQYRYQLELSTARLKMLQAQINPHFFYNTLQFIGSLAIKKKAFEVSDKLAELGAMFRYSMDIDTEEVTLQDELDHVHNYISLQTGRFQKKLRFTERCPEEALTILVPKMILQPIVENSIVHGIEKGRGSGTISLEIERKDKLIIRVTDNGCGFANETIEEIKQLYAETFKSNHESRVGIGLINVLKRLQLYCGNGFEWSIKSVPYVETAVTFIIPIRREKEVDRNEGINRR